MSAFKRQDQLSPKILSYYLPQFYSIPENDKWHGKGFTEWTKVRSAKPLFTGHDQPRIPHPDLGYYQLDNPDILNFQANLMRLGGVDGQVIYHYWFGGKQILEKPAQILLANPDIQMDFAFCWANESWTQRWDGGSGKILLDQSYSLKDAEDFIQYLIPFFHDQRYIKIHGRPLLMIYRPSLIPSLGLIVELWNSICLREGCKVPYLIAAQTGNTSHAAQVGFSAEVERPMYNLESISNLFGTPKLENGKQINKFASYAQIAEKYSQTDPQGVLPVHPSVVVSWDVSPRHGADGLILDYRDVDAYEQWLGNALSYSKTMFPQGEQLVFLNAWNEWAEGAYLEPDVSSGYEYLLATSRAKLANVQQIQVNKA